MSSGDDPKASHPSVRFSSHNEEISPDQSLQMAESSSPVSNEDLSPEAHAELRNLTQSLQSSRLQSKRLEHFSYEPVSLPVSRAASPASASGAQTPSSAYHHAISPRPSPPSSAMHSPPLTPAGTYSIEGKPSPRGSLRKHQDPALMTPQVSPPHEPPPTSIDSASTEKKIPSSIQTHSPRQSGDRQKPIVDAPVSPHPRQPPNFTIGPQGDSLPPSREHSPTRTSGAPSGTTTPGTQTPVYSRPFTPAGEKDDPYARSRRAPPSRHLDALDARFIFAGKDPRRSYHRSPSRSTSGALPRSSGNFSDREEKSRHGLFGSKKHDKHHDSDSSSTKANLGKPHGSMSELKRFFKIGGHKHGKEKRSQSPAPSVKSTTPGTATPPSRPGSMSVPFADDHGLESKYGKFGKVLGSGAGGSVRLMKRSSDGVTFAVKQFRARHSYESEREYNKKVTAEFCVGSTLHHGNIIETMDLVHEKGNWYVVMEYAPYDLFAIVMTGKMTREEISCATLQILSGVTYLHSMGLAHRDLKLDNVVVNEHGIMKIIDFGSAAVFRYPFENDLVLASGIVGSDPYLAPEVYDLAKYDPQPTDIWSLAIIFCCMTLRRFPWKAPRLSDTSYKLFVAQDNTGTLAPKKSADGPSKSAVDLTSVAKEEQRKNVGPRSEPASREPSHAGEGHHHHHHRHEKEEKGAEAKAGDRPAASTTNVATEANGATQHKQQQEVIKGPWRLLRLLPRESRHIIGRMLDVNPKTRATMPEILADKWVATTPVCRQEEGGVVIKAGNHEHTLEPGSGAPPPPANRK